MSATPTAGGGSAASAQPKVIVVRHQRARAICGLIMIVLGLLFFILAMINFPLSLIRDSVRQSLIIQNTPESIDKLENPDPLAVKFTVFNYTSITESSINVKELSYTGLLYQNKFNITFIDNDNLIQYSSRNEFVFSDSSFGPLSNDVLIQPSFTHFTLLATSRASNIPKVLKKMANGTFPAPIPPISDLTTKADIPSPLYQAFVAAFSQSTNVNDFIVAMEHRNQTGVDRFSDVGVSATNSERVLLLLNQLGYIGFTAPSPSLQTDYIKTTPRSILMTFLGNQTTPAQAYKPGQYYEKYTGKDDILMLKRFSKYKGSEQVIDQAWASPEVVRGLRDVQADSFPDQVSKRLMIFSPATSRAEQWNNMGGVDLMGLSLVRFERDPATFQNATSNSANAKFLMYGPNGIFNMNPSGKGPPVHFSNPHFLDGDTSLWSGFTGVAPSPDEHMSFIDIEPNTGMPFRAMSRFQANLRLENGMVNATTTPNLIRGAQMYLPLWWAEIGGTADQDQVNTIKSKLITVVQACSALRLIFAMAALPLFCYGIYIVRKYKSQLLCKK